MYHEEILRVRMEKFAVTGVRKVWWQLNREGARVTRCTVERLMREPGISGAVRGGRKPRTTVKGDLAERPLDLVARNFSAERLDQPWVSDLTSMATWRGFVYAPIVIDAFSRRIVGWRVSTSLSSDLALDSLEQAICEREQERAERQIYRRDRGGQYRSVRYTEPLAETGIEPSVGSRGDSVTTRWLRQSSVSSIRMRFVASGPCEASITWSLPPSTGSGDSITTASPTRLGIIPR